MLHMHSNLRVFFTEFSSTQCLWISWMNREIEARQRNYATVNLFFVRKFSSENDQVSPSRWSALDKINGGLSCRAVVSEGRLRQSNLSNLSYIYYRTEYGISRLVAQADADNRFKLTPRRWIRQCGGRSFLITRWELCLPWSNRCSINISSNFFFFFFNNSTNSPIQYRPHIHNCVLYFQYIVNWSKIAETICSFDRISHYWLRQNEETRNNFEYITASTRLIFDKQIACRGINEIIWKKLGIHKTSL